MFSSSIPENITKENPKAVRCINFFNYQVIEEKDDHFYFTSYGQSDFKMPIPESFLNFTIPSKFTDWFENYHDFCKVAYKDK